MLSTVPSNGDVSPYGVAFRDVAHKSDDRGGAAVAVGVDLMFADVEVSFQPGSSFGLSDRDRASTTAREWVEGAHLW